MEKHPAHPNVQELWISWVKKKMGNETAWILASALLGTFKADVQVGAWGQLIGKTLYRCFLKCLLLECSVLPNDPCESAARRLGLLSNAGDGRRGTIFSSFGSSAGDLREPLDLLHGYHFSKQISYSWLPNKRVATCRSILANFALYTVLLGCYT